MDIKLDGLKSLDGSVKNVLKSLNIRNVSIYGDFIKDIYVYEYKHDTDIEHFIMKKDQYNKLILTKGVPDYTEEYYKGIRDFKGSLLYSYSDKDLNHADREKFVISFMIAAAAHDIYNGDFNRFSEVPKLAYYYINRYGYDLNWKSKCCFPFEIKTRYDGEGVKTFFLEDSIIDAVCKYTIFEACGKRMLREQY